MKVVDIHSHILPGVDDGAKDLEMSLALLEEMKKQGITDVIATPHFDAQYDNMEDFNENVKNAKIQLFDAVEDKNLPQIHIGAEVYYFKGIGKSYGAKNLTLANSKYILLELPRHPFDDDLIKDIQNLYDVVGLTPILAHIERYAGEKGFKKVLKLIDSGVALAQINAPSVFTPPFKRVVSKLIKKGYVSFIATDSHSIESRPPMLEKALEEVEKQFGGHQKRVFLRNYDKLYHEILGKGFDL
ncbi:MAG: hypothetical protein IKK24_05565 [Clostridia bacterium]|nr:hypothetical protein [Clostridia bacterium]